MKPLATIDACTAGHRRLLARLRSMGEEDLVAPSLLPGYSRAEVAAHLTNKARAHVSLFEGAAHGEVRRLHPEGYDPDGAAHRGAQLPAPQLIDALSAALEDLESAWERLDDGSWGRLGIMTAGPKSMAEIVGHHQRNVEVHHVDLDVGYRPQDWPAGFVEVEVAKRLAGLRDRADHADLLAWLLGRAPAPDLGPW